MVPAHFEADAYAGLRRMIHVGAIARDRLPAALDLLARMAGERVPLGPLLRRGYELFDRIGAHDVFYVVIAELRGARLLTTDLPLARAAQALGVDVLYHDPRAEPIH